MKYPVELYVIFFALLFFGLSIKVCKEDVRLVVFRFGKYFKIAGPGIVYTMPVFDKVIKVNLPEAIPDWRILSTEQLNEQIKNYILYK